MKLKLAGAGFVIAKKDAPELERRLECAVKILAKDFEDYVSKEKAPECAMLALARIASAFSPEEADRLFVSFRKVRLARASRRGQN